jgi:hypothetical protein
MSPEGGRVGGVVSPLHTEEREGGGSMCGGERGGGSMLGPRSHLEAGGWVFALKIKICAMFFRIWGVLGSCEGNCAQFGLMFACES